MNGILSFVAKNAYSVLFATVLIEQLGLPIPAFPVLVTAGALARASRLGLAGAVALAVLAFVAGHLVWYEAGRRRGAAVLRLLCKLAIEPDSCVRRTEDLFLRYGWKSLLIAPFVPGLSAIAPPLAGMSGMRRSRFVALESLGGLLWSTAYVSVGWVFAEQLERALAVASRFGTSIVVLAGLALALYIAVKLLERSKLLRHLRVARITPEELKAMLDRGEPVTIVDLRRSLEGVAQLSIPGALVVSTEELEERWRILPRDREIVLACD